MEAQRHKTLERFKEVCSHKIDDPIEWHQFKKYYELGVFDTKKEFESPLTAQDCLIGKSDSKICIHSYCNEKMVSVKGYCKQHTIDNLFKK